MALKLTPQQPSEAPEAEAPKPVSPPISFAEPDDQVREGVEFTEAPKPEPVKLTDREFQALYADAETENEKIDFYNKVAEANALPEPPPQLAGPVPPRVAAQTKAEMEHGASLVAKQAEIDAQRPPRPKDPYFTGHNTEVMRPGSFVPDQKKGQGHTQARTL